MRSMFLVEVLNFALMRSNSDSYKVVVANFLNEKVFMNNYQVFCQRENTISFIVEKR